MMTRVNSRRLRLQVSAMLLGLATLVANSQPSAPENLVATAGDEEAVLTWEPGSNSGYELRFRAGEAPEFNTWVAVPSDEYTEFGLHKHTVSGLPNGMRYVFEMRAYDDDGAGEAASASTMLATSPSSVVEIGGLYLYILSALGIGTHRDITQLDLAKLRELEYQFYGPIADLTGLEFCVNLVSLDLSSNNISDVSALSGLTSLTWLDLSNNEIADVSPLSGLASLGELDLSGNKITNVSLSGLTSLYSLDLSGNKITNISLSGLTSLGGLELSGNEISDVSPLSDLASLTWLRLSNNEIADVSALSGLASLTELDLSNNEIADVSALSGLASLTELDLSNNEIADVSTLSGLTSLTRLDLPGNEISDVSTLSGLTSLRDLDLLDLSGNEIADVSALPGLTSLAGLDLSNNEIADVSALSGLTSLAGLDLSNNEISDGSTLSVPTSVRYLDLSGNEISDVSTLPGLTSLRDLDLLDLSGNEISDVSTLSGLTLRDLDLLDLSGNEISDVSALPGLTFVNDLDLSDNEISDISPLSGMTSLRDLDLSNNAISDVSPLPVAGLRQLFLHSNSISDILPLAGLNRSDDPWDRGTSVVVLSRNEIADISPLLDSGLFLDRGGYVDLRDNPLSNEDLADLSQRYESDMPYTVVDDDGHRVPLFPYAGGGGVEGFVRVINHSSEAGSVSIEVVDDDHIQYFEPVFLAIDAGQARHFNARDLIEGNPAKGLPSIGGMNYYYSNRDNTWQLVLRSELDIEVLSYGRTPDGFVTSLHDLVPEAYGTSMVPTFNPGSNRRQVSKLRMTNQTNFGHWYSWPVVSAWDDIGSLRIDRLGYRDTSRFGKPHDTREYTATQLEKGGPWHNSSAGIGRGTGKWRLSINARGVKVMSLLQSPRGHLANISTGTAVQPDERGYDSWERGGRYRVPLFLAVSSDIHGFLRIVNLSSVPTAITLRAIDEAGVEREPVVLTLKGGRALHLNSNDLESGNAAKGLPGIGLGMGDWHLEVSADRRFEVLAYARAADGFVTSLHDTAPRAEDGSLWIPFFNPGSNRTQASRLRLVNWGGTAADVTIAGTDDAGNSPGEAVRVSVPARSARDYMAWELETGSAAGLSGALGDGAGKWRLRVSAPADVEAMSLLGLPTGHVTNLSTTPRYPRE